MLLLMPVKRCNFPTESNIFIRYINWDDVVIHPDSTIDTHSPLRNRCENVTFGMRFPHQYIPKHQIQAQCKLD